MPLSQKLAEKGYYGASGSFISTGSTAQNYRSYPKLEYPQSPLVNIFQTFNNYANNKLRTWSSTTTSSQNSTAYNGEYKSITPLTDDVMVYTNADWKDDYWVRLIMWKQSVDALSLNALSFPNGLTVQDDEVI